MFFYINIKSKIRILALPRLTTNLLLVLHLIKYTLMDRQNMNYSRDINTIKDTALILEGGGMRCVFTSGVLDFFMEHNIEFPYTIGVSGGASNGLSYMSRQKGRSNYANTTLMSSHPYIGLGTLLKKGKIIDLEFLFKEFAFKIYPFDFDTFFKNKNHFEMVTTHCITGAAHYLSETSNVSRLFSIGLASCSLPIINPVVMVDGEPMTDGGLADSIPLARALGKGYKKAVVILTQNRGYRKSKSYIKIPPFFIPKFPMVRDMLYSRPNRYNEQLEWIEKLENSGQIIVIRPEKPLKVGRLTNDVKSLTELYNEGYDVAKNWYLKMSVGADSPNE